MKKEVLTLNKVIVCVLKSKNDNKTTITEVKACCDAVTSTLKELNLEEEYDNQLNIDVDDIMTQVMSRKSICNLGYNGETIELKKSYNLKELSSFYTLPGWIKSTITAVVEEQDKKYTKKKI